jgi:hypothetical protein
LERRAQQETGRGGVAANIGGGAEFAVGNFRMPFDIAESLIVVAEQSLGTPLPASYRASMLKENGGEIEIEGDYWELFPIADTSDPKRLSRTANHILLETKICSDWSHFPAGALAIAEDGSGDRLVFIKQGDTFEPCLYVWSHENGSLQKVADDFSDLKK